MTRQTSKPPSLEWSVVGTLAWHGVLGRPLKLDEIQSLLLKQEVSRAEVEATLRQLGTKVVEKDGWYSLKGQTVRYPDASAERYFRYKWWRVRVAIGLLRHLPFIRFVAVANKVADRSAAKDSDIDVLIVIRHGRLFLTRTLITGVLHFAGLRRHGTKISNRICLSFFITDDGLDLEPIIFPPYDIYLAYWITELVPVLDAGEYNHRLRHANPWVGRFVPRYEESPTARYKPSWLGRLLERGGGSKLDDFVEDRLAKWQLSRIGKRPPNADPDVKIVANHKMLKFHEKERRRLYREQWETAMKERHFDPKLITK